VLREWNKGEVYSRAFICPACAAVAKALKIGPNIPRFRHFFSTPARHVQGTEYAFQALANQKALLVNLLVNLGRLF
jgi:hypothetical protein